MRLVLFVPIFPRLSETFIVSKFLGLLERGVDAHVVAMREASAAEWERFPDLAGGDLRRRVHVMIPAGPAAAPRVAVRVAGTLARRPASLWPWVRGAPRDAALRRRLAFDSAIVRLAPDLLHFEFGALARGRMDLGRRTGARVAVSFRGFDLNYVGLDRPDAYDEVWRSADGFHFLGDDLWRRAVARGCPPDASRVLIPPAIDATAFDPGDAPVERVRTGPLRILSVGRLAWKKGYEFGMEAIRSVVDRGVDCHWEIVGDGPHYECVSFARHQLGLTDRVTLSGPLAPAAVRQRLAESDLFLHPAVSEGFGNAVLEAQAMRLPVVTTDADGLRSNVVDGETGWVVPRRDAGRMAAAVLEAAADPARRERMGRAGRQRVVERFGLEEQISRFVEFYDELMGRPPCWSTS